MPNAFAATLQAVKDAILVDPVGHAITFVLVTM
jgi:hypothetical protein